MSFAALQDRINAAALAKLANVAATVGGVANIPGIFNDSYTDPLNFAGSAPALLCASADISSAALGTAVVVNSVNYTVAGIEPDGTGMTRLRLQEA